ncbi:MAG: hypothetical protein AB7I59_12095 [Geminicoccaceae bacterium]
MHEDDREADDGAGVSSLSDRRSALLKLLAGSGAAYSAPLVASFSMGGLSLPAQAAQPPLAGNQCLYYYGGNQPRYQPHYRIDFKAAYRLAGVGPSRFVPVYLLVFPADGLVVDPDGWSCRTLTYFGIGTEVLVEPAYPVYLNISNSSSIFTLVPEQEQSSGGETIRGGGPLVLSRYAIINLTADNRYPVKPFTTTIQFGASFNLVMNCGLLSIKRVSGPARLTGIDPLARVVPSGQIPLAKVPSGEP